MTASSPIQTAATLPITCPDWCRANDPVGGDQEHSPRLLPLGGGFAPTVEHWGFIGTFDTTEQQNLIDGSTERKVVLNSDWAEGLCEEGVTADELRQLAADAIAAAEWLEAQRA